MKRDNKKDGLTFVRPDLLRYYSRKIKTRMILTVTTDIGEKPIFDSAIISPVIAIKRSDSRSEPFLIISIEYPLKVAFVGHSNP